MINDKKPIDVLVADDEPAVRQGIREFLSEEAGIGAVHEATDGARAAETIRTVRPELVFLDVQMPAMSGFDVLAQLPERELPTVVFVTAYEQYALKAFDAHAVDYLLKPFDRQRFHVAFERAQRQVAFRRRGESGDVALAGLLSQVRMRGKAAERFVVKEQERILLVPVNDIEWIEASGNYVHLHHRRGMHLVRDTLTHVEQTLDPHEFVRIHRSAIVRISSVSELERQSSGDFLVRLSSGRELTLSRNFRRAFEDRIGRAL